MFPMQRQGESASDKDIEEERRLFYVGVTRAMDQLTLSACMSRLLYGQRQTMEPSRFLLEIPKQLLRKANPQPSSRVFSPLAALAPLAVQALRPVPNATPRGTHRAPCHLRRRRNHRSVR